MGLRTVGLACSGLWMGIVAAAEVAALLVVPLALGMLLAAVTGLDQTSHLGIPLRIQEPSEAPPRLRQFLNASPNALNSAKETGSLLALYSGCH